MIKVIPVIDVMNNVVVHAIAGEREKYKPLESSVLVEKPNPYKLLEKLKDLGFDEVYIADLDSIMSRGNNFRVVRYAANIGLKVLADIGSKGIAMVDTNDITYVLGTEYLEDFKKVYGRTISLDMYKGNVLMKDKRLSLKEALDSILKLNLKTLLLISLDRVGTFKGPDLTSISTVRRAYTGRFIVGGGVRGVNDVLNLKQLGVDGVLIASSLHKGIIRSVTY